MLSLYWSEAELDTPNENKPYAHGGILIVGKRAIYEQTLYRFDGEDGARHIVGRLECPGLDDLLRQDGTIVRATREGLDYNHAFARALRTEVEHLLDPFVQEARRAYRTKQQKMLSEEFRRKLGAAIRKLNEIARIELEVEPEAANPDPNSPEVPESGFGFMPVFYNIVSGKGGTLLLRCLSRLLPAGSVVDLVSDNAEVEVVVKRTTLEERENYPWLLEARLRVEGGQVNNTATIVAESEGYSAEALVHVVAARIPPKPDPTDPPRKRGLISDIKFDPSPNPPSRVRFDRASGDIIVYIGASSVKPYVDADDPEALNSTGQGQVLLAELVLEAVSHEIVRRNTGTGKITLVSG